MRLIVLHVGMPKTGTSALQRGLLRQSRENGTGLLYPETGRGRRVAHHSLARSIKKHGADVPEVSELVREACAADVPVIISSEVFNNVRPDILARLVERLEAAGEVKVVLVVREMASFLESMYLQSTRTGRTTISVERYLALRTRNWFGMKCWLRERFRHIEVLRQRLGDRLVTPLVVPGFNSLDEIAAIAGCPPALLTPDQSVLSKNEKRSLKAQVVFLYLPEIEKTIGMPLDRRHLLKAFREDLRFENDVYDYTIVNERTWLSIGRKACKWANQHGFTAYTEAYSDVASPRRRYAELNLDWLTSQDIEQIAEFGKHADEVKVR